MNILSSLISSPRHSIAVEQKVTDLLTQYNQLLARRSEHAPMSWYTFQQASAERTRNTRKVLYSSDGSIAGMITGSIIGVLSVAGMRFLAPSLAAYPSALAIGLLGGGALGGAIGGSLVRSATDKREEMIDAYARYLQTFERDIEIPPSISSQPIAPALHVVAPQSQTQKSR